MSFPDPSEVAQAMENGVESPQQGSDVAPDAAPDAAPSIAELDKLEKFKFDGREYTPQELKRAILRQSDYTKKTQEFSQERKTHQEERKFYDNLRIDLKAVKTNPSLAAEFRKIYPQKFHDYLEDFMGGDSNTQPQTPKAESQYAQIDPELLSRFERVENNIHEKEVAAIEMSLEAQDKEFLKKYPEADIDAVYAKVEAVIKRNESLPKDEQVKVDAQIWERVYKADHEKHSARYEARYKENINKQKQAGLNGRDSGSGGAVAGGAPKTYKNLREARDALLSEFEN